MDNDLFLQSQWLFHIYDGLPRIMLFLPKDSTKPIERLPEVSTRANYIALIKSHLEEYSCYTSVYPSIGIFNKIYVDLDSETDIQKALDELAAFLDYFRTEYHYVPRAYFTGCKGFAVYVDFPFVKLKHMEATVREFVRRLQRNLNLTTVDWAAIGQSNRVSRIPYTWNVTSGNLCIPLDVDDGLSNLEDILDSSIHGWTNVNIEDSIKNTCPKISEELYDIDEHITDPKQYKSKEIKLGEKPLERLRIVKMILRNAPNVTDHRHRILFCLLVPHLVWAGFDLAAIKSVCYEWLTHTPEDGRKDLEHYMNYINSIYARTLTGSWNAWSLRRFITEYPQVGLYFKKVN